jgi:hypothetical protein
MAKQPPESDAQIFDEIEKTRGKTIVDFHLETIPADDANGAHETEVLTVYFTDGSRLVLETGSNAGNLVKEHSGMEASYFKVYFLGTFKPPRRA